jgi:ketosteroid isomerase-like protein
MKGLITVLAVLVVVGLAYFLYRSPSGPPEMTGAEIAQIQTEVEAMADQMMTAFNNLDTEAATALFDPSSMDGNDGSSYYANYDEWVAHVQDLFGRFQELSSEWTSRRVDVLAPDVALFVGQNEARVTQTDGSEYTIHGYMTDVVRKIDGAWKIIHQASVGRWTAIESEPEG